jgi:hypothetical protein
MPAHWDCRRCPGRDFTLWRPRHHVLTENDLGNLERDTEVPGRDRDRDLDTFWRTSAILVVGDLVPQLPPRAGWRECGAMLIEKQLAGHKLTDSLCHCS